MITNPVLPPSRVATGVWKNYFQSPCSDFAAGITTIAMRHVYLRQRAMSIGFETVNDAMRLLDEGFHEVHNYDLCPGDNEQAAKLESMDPRFNSFKALLGRFALPVDSYDAIISNHGIAFCSQEEFPEVFNILRTSTRESGIVAVTLFGIHDEWNNQHCDFALFNEGEIKQLFQGFKILRLQESLFQGRYIDGRPKQWHYFKVVAMKETEDFLIRRHPQWSAVDPAKPSEGWKF